MIHGLIVLTELSFGGLLAMLGFRIFTLARTPDYSSSETAPSLSPAEKQKPVATIDRTELFTQLHILMGLQERDCRERGLDWHAAPPEVSHYTVAWLYGAACALCDKSLRHTGTLQGLVAQIGHRKTHLRQSDAVQTLTTLTYSSTWLGCFRHGLEGAEHWREHRFVPSSSSLYEAITNNAFI